jgi:hypothetical protein
MRFFNYIAISILCFVFSFANAQDNSEEVLKDNKVKEIRQYIKILAFERPTDTCLTSYTKFDENGNPIEYYFTLGCHGFKTENLIKYEYNKDQLKKLYFSDEQGEQYSIEHFYDKKGDLIRQEYFYYQLNDVSTTTYNYFYNKKTKQLDSFRTKTINPYEGNKTTLTKYEYEGDEISKILVLDNNEVLLSETIFEYDSAGNVINQLSNYFGEQSSFDQMSYSYDKSRKLIQTVDKIGRVSMVVYLPNGLIYQIRRFNALGENDSDLFNFYTYYGDKEHQNRP